MYKRQENDDNGISTELIEIDKERSQFLASQLNSVTITNGDGLDNQILDEVNIAEAGYCLAVTEDDGSPVTSPYQINLNNDKEFFRVSE